jgi:hypothetical protein
VAAVPSGLSHPTDDDEDDDDDDNNNNNNNSVPLLPM